MAFNKKVQIVWISCFNARKKRGKNLAIRNKEIIKETMQLCIKKTLLNGPKLVCFDLIKQSFSCLGGVKEQTYQQDSSQAWRNIFKSSGDKPMLLDVIFSLDSNKKSFDLQLLLSNKTLTCLFLAVSSSKWGVSWLCGKGTKY